MQYLVDSSRTRARVLEVIANLQPGRYSITVEAYKPKPNNTALRRFNAVIRQVAMETGNDFDDLRTYFKEQFIGTETREVAGQTIEVPSSSLSLTTEELHNVTNSIIAWSNRELNTNIPLERGG